MVNISEEVQDVLRSIYLHEIADGKVDTPSFWKCVNTLMKLDKLLYGYLRKPPRYSSWARGGMLMTSVCGYDFGFYWNEEEEFIDIVEVYKRINESKTINLSRSDMRMIVESVVYEALRQGDYGLPKQNTSCNEATINGRTYMIEKMMRKWKCVDGMYGDYNFFEFGRGYCQDVRMYIDTTAQEKTNMGTICLFRREDNGKYFYCTIVDAPEKGINQTKFCLLPYSKVPKEIRSDFRTLPLPPERVLASHSWHRKGNRSRAQ